MGYQRLPSQNSDSKRWPIKDNQVQNSDTKRWPIFDYQVKNSDTLYHDKLKYTYI